LDLDGTPRSAWNTSAVRVLVLAFAERENQAMTAELFDKLSKLAFTRVKTLRAEYRKMQQLDESKKRHNLALRRHNRKVEVSCLLLMTLTTMAN
jgi:hypothetical protein